MLSGGSHRSMWKSLRELQWGKVDLRPMRTRTTRYQESKWRSLWDRIPKRMLFGWLPQWRLAHGTEIRWRDRTRKDLKKIGIKEGSWYKVAQERGSWKERCRAGLEDAAEKRMQEDETRRGKKLLSWAVKLVVSLGKPLPCLSSVTLASVPSDAGRTLLDTAVSPLALKVKWCQGLQFWVLCEGHLLNLSSTEDHLLKGWLPFKVKVKVCVCVYVCNNYKPEKSYM